MPIARSAVKGGKPAAPQRLTAWSYSRYRDWKRCPAYVKYKHILRMPEPGNDAMARGGEIHGDAQKYVEARTTPKVLPDTLACFPEEFKELRKYRATCESEWAFNAQWAVTGWFDKDAWCRVKMDAHFVIPDLNRLVVVDHKTGKVPDGPEKYQDQEELYATAGLLQNPTVRDVEVRFYYLDAGVIKPDPPTVYVAKDLPALKKEWDKRVKPMMADTRFAPKANWTCKNCPYSKAKNGPCKF